MTHKLQILQGDALTVLRTMAAESVHCVCTSPPYWGLRDYGVAGQLGLEKTPEEYVAKMVEVFGEVRRALRKDGTCWVNLGDSYASGGRGGGMDGPDGEKQRSNAGSLLGPKKAPDGLKPKDLCGIPWRLAFALQADGWWLRQDIIWAKPNPMPESVTDRCTKAHEYIFLLTKAARYFFDAEAIKEPTTEPDDGRARVYGGRNKGAALREAGIRLAGNTVVGNGATRNRRSVWTVPTAAYSEAHFATFPPDLIKPCILAGTSAKGCCPKCGGPWERVVEPTAEYAKMLGRVSPHSESLHGFGRSNKGIASTEQVGLCASRITTGWRQPCKCGLPTNGTYPNEHSIVRRETSPCTVLDPFGGSGTTGMVALELGRKAILIELNPAYVKLAHKRCHVTPGLQLA